MEILETADALQTLTETWRREKPGVALDYRLRTPGPSPLIIAKEKGPKRVGPFMVPRAMSSTRAVRAATDSSSDTSTCSSATCVMATA